MSNEQRAHDLTMLYLSKIIDISNISDKNELEISMIEKYLHFYPIILEQLTASLDN